MKKPTRPLDALDILDEACAKLTFLQEIMPAASIEGSELRLSEFATCGFGSIMADINSKIENARALIE